MFITSTQGLNIKKIGDKRKISESFFYDILRLKAGNDNKLK